MLLLIQFHLFYILMMTALFSLILVIAFSESHIKTEAESPEEDIQAKIFTKASCMYQCVYGHIHCLFNFP